LQQRHLLPSVHLADTGFVDAELIVESDQRYQLDLLGLVRLDNHREARRVRLCRTGFCR
jgi:transposase